MITGLEIVQNNIVGTVNVMAVHNDLVFLIDATYTGNAPDFIYCVVIVDNEQQLVARCLYHSDITESIRRFIFVADEIIKGFMPSFDDFVQESGSFIECTNISKELTLSFQDDLQGTLQETIVIEAVHSARQIGESINLSDICLNNDEVFYCGENMPVYVYFYNNEPQAPTNLAYLIHGAGNYLLHNGDKLLATNN
jgi:hypothetical protein